MNDQEKVFLFFVSIFLFIGFIKAFINEYKFYKLKKIAHKFNFACINYDTENYTKTKDLLNDCYYSIKRLSIKDMNKLIKFYKREYKLNLVNELMLYFNNAKFKTLFDKFNFNLNVYNSSDYEKEKAQTSIQNKS